MQQELTGLSVQLPTPAATSLPGWKVRAGERSARVGERSSVK